ncbi:hypothetical protein BDW59DRAFT_161764 [Aspergillus cavernicola]|uniref:Uncharacterized protein n=1 Tax=Aspergillus cavernicola TaxID=176166 RepID=A0ABR4IDC9_9EURO
MAGSISQKLQKAPIYDQPQEITRGEVNSSQANGAMVTRSQCLSRPNDPSTPELKGAEEKVGRRHTRKGRLSGNTASWEGGSAPGKAGRGRKKEEKRMCQGGRRNPQKRREDGAIPKAVSAIPHMIRRSPSSAGGGGRQAGGSMAAVSGAPLTVTTDTL